LAKRQYLKLSRAGQTAPNDQKQVLLLKVEESHIKERPKASCILFFLEEHKKLLPRKRIERAQK
jgi:predicted HTH transcriptional regulator